MTPARDHGRRPVIFALSLAPCVWQPVWRAVVFAVLYAFTAISFERLGGKRISDWICGRLERIFPQDTKP